MKRFVVWALVVCMLMSMSMIFTTAVADGVQSAGDVYSVHPVGWPVKHWAYMSADEIAVYEAAGWERYSGVLWYDSNWNVANFQDVKVSQIQELYNTGYTFHVIYSWTCPANLLGKNEEQSVTVGRWMLSPDQAVEYHKTYVKPQFSSNLGQSSLSYVSQLYYNGLACELDGTESEDILNGVLYIRHQFNTHDFGFGSKLYLANGSYEQFGYADAVAKANAGQFNNELPKWD